MAVLSRQFPVQLRHVATASLPTSRKVVDEGTQPWRSEASWWWLRRWTVPGWLGRGQQPPDGPPMHAEGTRDALDAGASGATGADLLPASHSARPCPQALLLRLAQLWFQLWLSDGELHVDTAPPTAQHLLQRGTRAAYQVEPVRHLDGFGRALAAGLGVGLSAVTHQHLDARVRPQPDGQWLAISAGVNTRLRWALPHSR